ncbi:MAG: PfkB family carbohydrate kinase [Patescibacteria group bacterium]|mgnify:FL=1
MPIDGAFLLWLDGGCITHLFMDQLHAFFEGLPNRRVLVVGDIMVDWYTYGSVNRVSPEAPVPVLHKTGEKFLLGGAGNVAYNAAKLGARVTLAGTVGDDVHKETVFSLLREHRIGACLLIHREKPTIIKHRMVAGSFHQLLRVDEEDAHFLDDRAAEQLMTRIEPLLAASDIIVLSDYAKGTLNEHLAQRLIVRAHELGKLVIADIKPKTKEFFRGTDVLCPNVKEAREMAGADDDVDAEKVGQLMVADMGAALIMTRGGDGISAFTKTGDHTHIHGRKVQVYDVTGAGDTVIAVAAVALASGFDLVETARIANAAAAIVVQKAGVAAVAPEELGSALGHMQHHVEEVGVVPKVWGYEKWLENNDKYCCKLLVLHKGYQCSLHYHEDKDEMFLVTKGHVRLEMGEKVIHMYEGNYVRLEPGTVHRFTGIEDAVIVEVSTTHREEDSHRIENAKPVIEEITKYAG